MFTNELCRKLGMDVPIVLAPMAGAVGVDLACEVANAGGLGVLPLWSVDDDTLRKTIAAMKTRTARPFAVNLNLDFPQERRLDICLEEAVPIISFFWKQPGHLIKRAKDAGAIVMHSVGSSDEAKRAVDDGADIIVAQGWEAGGHVCGTVATLPLIPSIVDAVPGTPVIAAGGIADGRGLAAVLALGAEAAWIGTRFLSATEATIHTQYRDRLLSASDSDTRHFDDLFDVNWPNAAHRVLNNSTIEKWEAAGRPAQGARPGEGEIIATSKAKGDVRRYQSYTPAPDTVGDVEACSMWSGQGVGLVRKTQPAAEIVNEIMAQARATLAALSV